MSNAVWTADPVTYLTNFLNMNSFDGALKGKVVECCLDEDRVVFEFPGQEWQNNEHGGLHGGIMASIFDLAMGIVCSYLAGENGSTTTDLQVSYMNPGELTDTLLVKVYLVKRGGRIYHTRGELYAKERGKLIATAAGSWLAL